MNNCRDFQASAETVWQYFARIVHAIGEDVCAGPNFTMTPAQEIHLNPGDILYYQGGENDCAFVIEAGEIIIFKSTDGVRKDIERRGPGAIVGELSILTGQSRAVTVEAVTHCRLFKISANDIISLFEKLDPVLRACIETSINFATIYMHPPTYEGDQIPLVPSTLRNADKLIERFKFENDLLNGLERNEFSMVYQPIVQIEDGLMVGVEALMRWKHPEKGSVPTQHFIEVAEEQGSISKLTDFALLQSCLALKRMRALPNAPEGLYASVNISGQDIGRKSFVDFLAHVLDLNELKPEHIKLEVTETALILDVKTAESNFKRLRALGCGISIDDFGTGYSNLGYLKSLPLTALKIDRAFAGDAHANAVSRGIVRVLVALGKELGVDIIAEGVETGADVKALRDLGCRFAQGYYFHKPMPEKQISQLITDGTSRDVA